MTRAPPSLLFALVVTSALTGCLSPSPEAWWYTPEEAWDHWPGMNAPTAEAPKAPLVASFAQDRLLHLREEADRLASDGALLDRSVYWYLDDAEESLHAGAPTWALQNLQIAGSILLREGLHDEEGGSYDESALEAFMEASKPLEALNETEQQLAAAWPETSASGLPALLSLLGPLGSLHPARQTLQAIEDGEEPGGSDARSTAASATSVLTFSKLADPLIENATRLPGPAPHEATLDDVAPLLHATSELTNLGANALGDLQDSRQVSKLTTWGLNARDHARLDQALPAAVSALTALVYAETLDWSYENRVPDTERVLQDLARVSNVSSPAGTFFAHLAWHGYAKGGVDPAFMLVPVAVAQLWPLIEAVCGLIVDGDPVDWSTVLDPPLERWSESFLPNLREHA